MRCLHTRPVLNQKPATSDYVHGLGAILGIHLPKDPMNMILDGLF